MEKFLVSVDEAIKIVDGVADVKITQLFRNTEHVPVEINYVFPVDDRAVVHHIEGL